MSWIFAFDVLEGVSCFHFQCGAFQKLRPKKSYLLCPESWPWRSRWYLKPPLPKWSSCRWEFSRRSAFLLGVSAQGEEYSPSGCCNQRGCVRLRVVCRRRSNAAGPAVCLLKDENEPSNHLSSDIEDQIKCSRGRIKQPKHTFFVLNLGLDILDGIWGLHLQSNGLAGEGFHEDLHSEMETESQSNRLSTPTFHQWQFVPSLFSERFWLKWNGADRQRETKKTDEHSSQIPHKRSHHDSAEQWRMKNREPPFCVLAVHSSNFDANLHCNVSVFQTEKRQRPCLNSLHQICEMCSH